MNEEERAAVRALFKCLRPSLPEAKPFPYRAVIMTRLRRHKNYIIALPKFVHSQKSRWVRISYYALGTVFLKIQRLRRRWGLTACPSPGNLRNQETRRSHRISSSLPPRKGTGDPVHLLTVEPPVGRVAPAAAARMARVRGARHRAFSLGGRQSKEASDYELEACWASRLQRACSEVPQRQRLRILHRGAEQYHGPRHRHAGPKGAP